MRCTPTRCMPACRFYSWAPKYRSTVGSHRNGNFGHCSFASTQYARQTPPTHQTRGYGLLYDLIRSPGPSYFLPNCEWTNPRAYALQPITVESTSTSFSSSSSTTVSCPHCAANHSGVRSLKSPSVTNLSLGRHVTGVTCPTVALVARRPRGASTPSHGHGGSRGSGTEPP
jgi:hypothetical protein